MMCKARIYRIIKKMYSVFLCCAEFCFGLEFTKRMDVMLRFRKRVNLKHPQTLADKVSYISLYGLSDKEVRCTDKWEVRKYVAEKGLEHILIPVHGSATSSVDELDFSVFPNQFVLKATHGCRMNYICLDKEQLNQSECKKMARQWLKTTYGTYSVEPHYREISHRVYCETYIGDDGRLIDYKIHCLNGEPSFILVCGDRNVEEGRCSALSLYLFDTQWNPIDMLQRYRSEVPGEGIIPKPKNLAQMLAIARKLSEDFNFVRVDLYESDGRVLFGELTFTPANGVFPYFKQELLDKEGAKLTISIQ